MRKKALKIAAGLFLLMTAAAVQQGEIPPTNDETHKGQPAWCQNFRDKEYKANCDCKPKMGDAACKDKDMGGENPKCKVYCRKDACNCSRECDSHARRKGPERNGE